MALVLIIKHIFLLIQIKIIKIQIFFLWIQNEWYLIYF
jgi:hypothetical protein